METTRTPKDFTIGQRVTVKGLDETFRVIRRMRNTLYLKGEQTARQISLVDLDKVEEA